MQPSNPYLLRVKAFIKRVITVRQSTEPETKETRNQEVTIRDLKPEKDAMGGGPPSRSTVEIDFMKDVE